MPTNIEILFLNLAEKVHSGKLTTGQIDKEVATFVANNLLKGVYTGFESDFNSVDYNTPDFEMLKHLEKNVYYFSCAKQYHEVVELNDALRDGQRELPFNEFKQKAFAINEKYNATHLRPEYNHAVGSSQMARRWVDIQEAKATHPLLRYDTVGDDRVRLAHQELEGITKPIDDSFWDSWYPPNGWNCRCDVQQVQDGKITPADKINTPTDVPDMFKINTAKLGMVYPPKHPYWALPKIAIPLVKQEAINLQTNAVRKEIKQWSKEFINEKTPKIIKLPHIKEFQQLTVSRNCIKNILSHGHDFAPDLYRAVRHIERFFDNAKYLGHAEDLKVVKKINGKEVTQQKHTDVLKWHYYQIEFMGEPSYLNVKQTHNKEWKLYAVSDKKTWKKNKLKLKKV